MSRFGGRGITALAVIDILFSTLLFSGDFFVTDALPFVSNGFERRERYADCFSAGVIGTLCCLKLGRITPSPAGHFLAQPTASIAAPTPRTPAIWSMSSSEIWSNNRSSSTKLPNSRDALHTFRSNAQVTQRNASSLTIWPFISDPPPGVSQSPNSRHADRRRATTINFGFWKRAARILIQSPAIRDLRK